MGADGHIAIYDSDKLAEIIAEINGDAPEGERIHWPGYTCGWTCNGKPASLLYWGEPDYETALDRSLEPWWENTRVPADQQAQYRRIIERWKQLKERLSEAELVDDQEVWT